MSEKKQVDDASGCFECEQLYEDNGTLRCSLYDDAFIENINEKHCKDSIK